LQKIEIKTENRKKENQKEIRKRIKGRGEPFGPSPDRARGPASLNPKG
jgi:hypothetical protein